MEERETTNLTLEETLNRLKWRRSQNWRYVHWYIIKGQGSATIELFEALSKAIADSPFFDSWKGERYANLYYQGYKYWQMAGSNGAQIINRKPAEPPTDGLDGGEANHKLRMAQGASK